MKKEKVIFWLGTLGILVILLLAFISGTFWIDTLGIPSKETENRRWLFILITCIVILSSLGFALELYDYIKKPERRKKGKYVNRKKTNIAKGLLASGSFLILVPLIILFYLLALIPEKDLVDYIYIIVIIWVGIILGIVGAIYANFSDAYKTVEQTN